MTSEDITVAQALLAQLGYVLDVAEVRRRFGAVTASNDHAVLVAEHGGRVVALCHMYVRPALDKLPEVVVQALVVDRTTRGSSVGKSMMAAAEAWAQDRGFTSVALASNVARTEAHTFYLAIGYQRTSTSHLFRKTWASSSGA